MVNWVPGEIIPDTEFYHLEAVDVSGIKWESKSVYVKLAANHMASSPPLILIC